MEMKAACCVVTYCKQQAIHLPVHTPRCFLRHFLAIVILSVANNIVSEMAIVLSAT